MTISAQFDRVKFSVTGTPGTGAVTVGSAVTGFRTPAGASIADGTVCTWLAVDGTAWEVWQGAYTVSTTSIARTTLEQSSTGVAISLTSAAIVACITAAGGGLTVNPGLRVSANASDTTITSGTDDTINVNNAGSQSKVTFSFGGTIIGGVRCDSSGNFNWHATGSQAHQFYSGVGENQSLSGYGIALNASPGGAVGSSGPAVSVGPNGGALIGLRGGSSVGTDDVLIYRDAANVWTQRNGVTAQSYTLYNLYTDAANNEYAALDWQGTANVLAIGANAMGTGTLRGVVLTGAGISLPAGTTTYAPLTFVSGTKLTSAAAGATEFDGLCFYKTAVASARQVVDAEQIQVLNATRTLTNNTSAQAIFNATANGAITLAAATTYEFEMLVAASGFSSSSHTIQLGFGGTATFTSIGYQFDAQTASTLATPTAALSGYIAVATASAVTASATTTGLNIYVRGTMRINAGGTVIPQLTQVTASAAAVVQPNSFFRCWAVGANTVTNVGNWS